MFFVFLDLSQQNVGFLGDVLHNPFALAALVGATAGLCYAMEVFNPTPRRSLRKLCRDTLHWLILCLSLLVIILVAILVK